MLNLINSKINLTEYAVGFGPEKGQPTTLHADRPGHVRIYGPHELAEAVLLVDVSNQVRRRGGSWRVYEPDGTGGYRRTEPRQRTDAQPMASLADVEPQLVSA